MSDITTSQYYIAYWNSIHELKFHIYYLEKLISYRSKREKYLDIFITTITSGSVGSWAIWRTPDIDIIWVVLIGIVQVLTIIKPYLSWSKEINNFTKLVLDYSTLYSESEKEFFSFRFNKKTNDEHICMALINFNARKEKILRMHNPIAEFMNIQKLIKEAENETELYFEKYVGGYNV